MKKKLVVLLLLAFFSISYGKKIHAAPLEGGHYLYLGSGLPECDTTINCQQRERAINQILDSTNIKGVQIVYWWSDIEKAKNVYDFTKIERDINFLKNHPDSRMHNKKIIMQFTGQRHHETSTDKSTSKVPRYLYVDPEYEGGVAKYANGTGWYPIEWQDADARKNPSHPFYGKETVTDRLVKVILAIGQKYGNHPNIEGINSAETSFGVSGNCSYAGYNPAIYLKNLKRVGKAMKQGFPDKMVIMYSNFFPCARQIFNDDAEVFRNLIRDVSPVGVGLGGPDVKSKNELLLDGAYKAVNEFKNQINVGYSVQWEDYEEDKLEDRQTVKQIVDFSQTYLGSCYLFWGPRKTPAYYDSTKTYYQLAIEQINTRTLTNCKGVNGSGGGGGGVITATPTLLPSITGGVSCNSKYKGNSDCKNNAAGKAVDLLDYAIWYSEFIGGCSETNINGCGVNADGQGTAMDANFNFPGSSHFATDMKVDVFDYAVWIQGFTSQ